MHSVLVMLLALDLAGAAAEAAPAARILVLPFEVVGFPASTSEDLARVAAVEVGKVPGKKAILRSDIAAAFTYQTELVLAGCQDDAACLADVGAALSADKLLTGRVARLGQGTVVSLTLIDVARMDVERRRLEETSGGVEALPAVVRKMMVSMLDAGHAGALALPEVDASLSVTKDEPDIVVDRTGMRVMGAACFDVLPSGRIPGELSGSGLILPLLGCVIRDRHRMNREPLVAVDQSASTSLVLRTLYTLGRAEFGVVRLAARGAGGAGFVKVTLPTTQVVGCKEKWSGFTDGSIPVSIIGADEGLYVGGPGALLPGPGGPGVNGPTLPVASDGKLDTKALATLLGQVRKAWPKSYFVISPSTRLTWADFAAVLATASAMKADVVVGTNVARSKGAGGKVEVRVITSRPAQAPGELEPEFPPSLVMQGGTAGFTLRGKE